MLELEVLASPDREVLGGHRFFLPRVVVGRSRRCQLVLGDPEAPRRLVWESGGGAVFVRCPDVYHFNGKRVSGRRMARRGDRVLLGGTEIVLSGHDPASVARPFEAPAGAGDFADSPEWGALLEAIEGELVLLDGLPGE